MAWRRSLISAVLVACTLGEPAPGAVSLVVDPPDATVSVAGRPASARVDLPPGTYPVHAERTGFAPTDATVVVTSGATTPLEIVLSALPQPVHLVTVPPGATVLVGDAVVGTTPLDTTLPAGPVHLEVVLDGYERPVVDAFLDGPLDRELWLDRAGQLVDLRRMIPSGPQPKAVAIHPDGRTAWVACLDGPPSVTVHDLVTGAQVGSIDLGAHGAVELAFSADGATVWAVQMETATVFEIDVATRAVRRAMRTRSIWSKLVVPAPDGHAIYVSNWLGDDISEIDLATGDVRRLPTVRIPRGIYPTRDGAALYVTGFDQGELARIDLATGRSTTVFSGGANLRHVVGDEDHGRLFVSDMGAHAIWVHDLASGETRRLARTDPNPNTIDLTPDGRVLFVSCRGKNGPGGYLTVGDERGSVLAIDTATGAVLDAIVGGDQPTALDVSGDGTLLVFSDFREDRLQVFDVDVEALLAGGGGRAATYRADLRRR